MLTEKKLIEILLSSGADIDKGDIEFSKTFEELDLDSLDIFNFFTEIDAELGVDVPDEEFEKLNTLKAVHDYLKKEVS